MSEEAKPAANPDELTETTQAQNIELDEKELERASGGLKLQLTDVLISSYKDAD
jgi:hypothetical protein